MMKAIMERIERVYSLKLLKYLESSMNTVLEGELVWTKPDFREWFDDMGDETAIPVWNSEKLDLDEGEVMMPQEWTKPWYRIHKDKAWKTVKFDEYHLMVLFRGKSVMVDYQVAKTDGLLSAVEKAGKEAVGEVKELLRELWKVVRPYKVEALARQQLADARPAKEPFSFKDTVKGIMYAVQFRGWTVYVVKNVVLKHGWKKAIEHAASQSSSEQHKELLRGLYRAA